MSRVGQSPIHFSENVQVTKENNIIKAELISFNAGLKN